MSGRRRKAWAVGGAFALAIGTLLVLHRPRAAAPAPQPPAPPAPVPLEAARVAGTVDGRRVLARTLYLLADGTEIALREGSEAALERVGEEVRLSLEVGEAYVDAPAQEPPIRVRTPHAAVAIPRGGVHVRASPQGTAVTVAHGVATVKGNPFGQELTRDETADVSPAGAIGQALRIDTRATVEWAFEARDRASLLANGGFENGFQHWDGTGYPETQVRIDRRSHLGRQSALVHFNAVREYDHGTPASDPLGVRPGRAHLLVGYVEYEHLEVGPEGGITLEVQDVRGADRFRRATAPWSGNSGWRKFRLDFVPPEGTSEVRVLLTRARNGAATQGKLRLDGLAVYEWKR